MREPEVLILGAGAAGLMAAITAGRRGRRVLLLDHADRPGKKILISGGGRCNFTNLHCAPENFLSENPHFARSALARYTPADFIADVERHGIRYHEKTLGQLFCDGSSREIVALLEQDCKAAGVTLGSGTRIGKVNSQPGGGFEVECSLGHLHAESVIVATGGLSIPKMGATGFGYDLARSFGIGVVEPRAGLVPLLFSPEDRDAWCDLAGLSAEVVASTEAAGGNKARPAAFREKVLITHRGLSGPAALQISSYAREGRAVSFDLAPGRQVFGTMLEGDARRSAAEAHTLLRGILPARLAERWIETHLTSEQRVMSNRSLVELEGRLHQWTFVPAGTEGYAKAEVTVGGISTAELDARTLEARKVPGLFFVGEVVDVTGWLGGYNFQWAWSSGFCAGEVA